MRRRILPLVVMLAWPFACHREIGEGGHKPVTSPERKPPAPVSSAPAPPPPTPGNARLTFTGAFERVVSGEGVERDGGGFHLRSADLEGPAHAGAWSLSGWAPTATDPAPYRVRLSAAERAFVWEDASGRDAPTWIDTRMDLALTLRAKDGATVTVKGTLIAEPVALANAVPLAVVDLLHEQSGAEVRRYSSYDFGRGRDPRSISVVVPQPAARALVGRLRGALGPGWVVYIGTTNWLGDERHENGAEVVVGPGATQLDILRLARSDAVNYDLGTEALVKKLREWDAALGIDIFHAETDTIELELRRAPGDPASFAADVYRFCPDVVDQGVGSVDALARSFAARHVFLWWD